MLLVFGFEGRGVWVCEGGERVGGKLSISILTEQLLPLFPLFLSSPPSLFISA